VNSVDPSGLDPFLLEHGWMERQGLFGRRAEAPDHRPRDSEPFQFQYWPEANRLYEHYLLQKKLGATKNEQVAGLVVKALIITNGDARKAFDLVYTMRNYGRGFPDNDIWAGTDHFLQNFVMQDYLSVESIPALDGLASFAGSISGFVANAYTLLKYSDFIRLNLLPRDKTGVPPSRPTWDQYEWGNAGAWAALWYSNKMHPTSPEWKSFIRWLDDITTPRPPVDDVPLYELGY
jgi:hypothetical protein